MGDCGRNSLHWAIHMKHQDIVSFLLIKGVNSMVQTIDQYTPLQLAVLHHEPEVLAMLLNQPMIDVS